MGWRRISLRSESVNANIGIISKNNDSSAARSRAARAEAVGNIKSGFILWLGVAFLHAFLQGTNAIAQSFA